MRRIAVFLACTIALTASAFSQNKADNQAIGVMFGFGDGRSDVALSYRNANFPVINLSWNFKADYLGATIDYYLLRHNVVKKLDWYLGVGGLVYFTKNDITLGARLPIGLIINPIDELEIFGEVGPTLFLTPASDFDLMGGIGIRYVF